MKCVSTVLESQTAAQSEDIPAHVISRRPSSLAAVSFYIKVCGMLLTSTAKLMYIFPSH